MYDMLILLSDSNYYGLAEPWDGILPVYFLIIILLSSNFLKQITHGLPSIHPLFFLILN